MRYLGGFETVTADGGRSRKLERGPKCREAAVKPSFGLSVYQVQVLVYTSFSVERPSRGSHRGLLPCLWASNDDPSNERDTGIIGSR